MGDWRIKAMRGYFRLAGTLAPRRAERQAFDLCFTPHVRPPVSPAARQVLQRAESSSVIAAGRRLQVYRWAGTEAAGTVLLAHGWNSRASRLTAWVEPLRARGFDVVAFDMPAHGDSEGKHTNGLEMAAAIGDVAAEIGRLHALVGHSAGGFAAGVAAAGDHLLGRPPLQVQRLVLISAVDDPGIFVSGLAALLAWSPRLYQRVCDQILEKFGHPMEAFTLTRIPGGWPQPTLLFHDPEDPEIPFAQAEAIAAARPNAQLVPFPGGHHRIARDPRVIELALDFLTAETRAAVPGG